MAETGLQGHQVICSAFIEKEGKFAVIFCPKFKVWRVPGGRPERGEKVEDTLLRELKEETGITFDNPTFVGFGQDEQFHVRAQRKTSRLILFFHVKTKEEILFDPSEAEDSKWVTFEELKNIQNKEGALTDLFERNPYLSF